MRASLISIGTELLFGQITNTNSVYLSQQLQDLGIDVLYHHTVGDNESRLISTIENAMTESDLIITTGGLGPTQDDITTATIAKVLGLDLVLDKSSLEEIETFYKKLGRPMTDNNVKQAYYPMGGRTLENSKGTAPGIFVEGKGVAFFALPGPPREMKHLFALHVLPYLREESGSILYYKILRTFGIGESALETKLEKFISNQTDPTLATYAKEGECSLRIASKRATLPEAKLAVAEMTSKIKNIIEDYIFSEDDEDLNTVVCNKLIAEGITIAAAESCTGGLFSGKLTESPGISSVFKRGYVTYSNEAKINDLGVDPSTLEAHGAVSEETAVEMALGAKAKSGTHIGISVTGIAGPDGGTEEKPVGTGYICVAFNQEHICRKIFMRRNDRAWNRGYAVLSMFHLLYEVLNKYF